MASSVAKPRKRATQIRADCDGYLLQPRATTSAKTLCLLAANPKLSQMQDPFTLPVVNSVPAPAPLSPLSCSAEFLHLRRQVTSGSIVRTMNISIPPRACQRLHERRGLFDARQFCCDVPQCHRSLLGPKTSRVLRPWSLHCE